MGALCELSVPQVCPSLEQQGVKLLKAHLATRDDLSDAKRSGIIRSDADSTGAHRRACGLCGNATYSIQQGRGCDCAHGACGGRHEPAVVL